MQQSLEAPSLRSVAATIMDKKLISYNNIIVYSTRLQAGMPPPASLL